MAGELPLPQGLGGGLGSERVQGPGVSTGGIDFGASSWQRLAQSGEQLSKIGTSTFELAHADRLKKELGDNAELELQARKDYDDLRVKHDGDPKGFEEASREYRKNGAGRYTGEQQKHFLKVTAGEEATGYGTLTASKHSRDVAKADQDVVNLMKANADKAEAAAAEGAQPGDPAYDTAIADYEAQHEIAVKAGRLPPQTLAASRQQFYTRLKGNTVGASAGKIYATTGTDEFGTPLGGYKRAREYLDGAVQDLPPDQREQARVAGQKVLNQKRSRSQEDFADLEVERKDYIKALENGVPIDTDGALKLRDDLWRRGYSGEAYELDSKLKTRLQVPAGLTPAQQSGAGAQLLAGRHADLYNRTAAAIGVDPAWVAAIGGIESAHKEYAQDPGSSYSGLFQLSPKEFREGGGKGSIYDAEENAKAFAVIAKRKIANFQAKYDRPPTPGEFYLMHQQGEGGTDAHLRNPQGLAWQNFYSTAEGQQKGVAYSKAAIRGNLPANLKPYAETMTSEQFTNFWINRVNRGIDRETILAGGGTTDIGAARPAGSPPATGGQTPGQIALDQEEFVKRSKTAWDHNGKQLAVDNLITDKSWATYQQAATLHAQKTGDDKFLLDVLSTKLGTDIVRRAQPMDPATRQNFLTQNLAEAERNGAAGPTVNGALKFAQEQFDAENKVAKEDKALWAVRYRGATPPEALTPQDGVGFARQLSQRAKLVAWTANERSEPITSALNKVEAESVKAEWNAANVEGKVRMLTSLKTALVPPEGADDNRIFEQTLEALGLDDPAQRGAAIVSKTNPTVAKEILYAQPAVAAKGGGQLSPNADKVLNEAMNSKISRELYPRLQDQNDLRDAARTLAIKRQGDIGGLYTDPDATQVERAVQDVFGDTGKINGRMSAAPPGYSFNRAWQAWGKLDEPQLNGFGGAYSPNGEKFSTDFIRDHAVLQQVSPRSNQYIVGIPDAQAPLGGFKPVLTQDGNTLIVNMKEMIDQPGQGILSGRTPETGLLGGRPAAGTAQQQRELIRRDIEQRNPLTPPAQQFSGEPATDVPQQLEGQLTPGNIDLNTRPVVMTEDGRPATVRSISIEEDGKHILIPTVVGGAIVSNDEAVAHYRATGENLGSFATSEQADKAGKAISAQEGRRIGAGGGAQRSEAQQSFDRAVFSDLKSQYPEKTDAEVQAMLDAVNSSMSKSRAHFFPQEAFAVNAGGFEARFGPQGSAPESTNIEDLRGLPVAEQEAILNPKRRR